MTHENEFLLKELIKSGLDNTLKLLRSNYTTLPYLNDEDKEMCMIIDAYFKAKPKIHIYFEDIAIEKGYGVLYPEYEYDIFKATSEIKDGYVKNIQIELLYEQY